jgi:hypothetical protein
VIDWNATAMTVMLRVPAQARSPIHDMTYVHIAIYDAVNAIDGRYSVFAVAPSNAVPWASKEAATAAAARRVLLTFYASQQTYIDSVYAAALALMPNDSTTTRGVAIGDTVATRFLALRAGDGRDAIVTYTWLPPGPGVYQPTPPGAAQYQPLNPWLAQLRPFSLISPSQFRAPGPSSLTSDVYARDFNEVKSYGSRDSSFTTPQQREIARFYTENPNVQLARNIRLFATSRGMSLPDNARLFAQLYVTIGDALITGFDSKYLYNNWRPVTAIRAADTDGNSLTQQDTTWLPLVTTPTHPEYVAAHGCALGGFAYALEKFFGTTNLPVTFSSTVTGIPHSFNNINEIVTETINARVYGGMHFRSSVEDGVAIAHNVAAWVANHYFMYLPIPTAGLHLWLRADAGIDTLNGTVSRWHDQSGNGNDAIQANASRQPLLVASALNGKPVVRFDGLNDKLGFTGSTLMTQFSLFVVLNNHVGTPGNDGNVITFGTNENFWFMGIPYPSGSDSIGMATGSDSWVRCSKPGLAAHDQWRNLSAVANQTMWSTTLRWDGYALPMVPGGSNSAISVPLGDATGSGGGIGGTDGAAAGTILAKCDVAEVIVYSVALSDSVRKNIETYLATKYGQPQPPIPTAGLQLWLRADAGVDTLNGKVSRWHDQSGNGNDAVQANASRQPLLVPGTLNGKPVISFDGLNDKLGFTGTTPMTQFSLFLVINNHSGSVGNTGNVLTFGANGNFWYMGMAIPDYGVDTLGMAVSGGNFGWVRGGTPGLVAHDKWRNLSVVLNQTIWNTTLQWDGNSVPLFPGGNAGAISVPLGDATGSGGGIGGADGVPVGTILAQCDVAEVIVYNVALSDAERKKIEYNLAVKYGLPLTFLGVAENPKGNLAERYVLEQNYPNPFNPSTTIRFQILNSSQVKLKVFDIVGREVATLVDERLQPGSYETTFNAKGLASGVYLYRLQAGNFVETKRLILLK